ncbi:class I SAM-dependent methyltransferase [Chloroflexota bacterium]
MTETQLFDEWPEYYERWFATPIGELVKGIEGELIHELLDPEPGEKILDAGCGTGIFTLDFLAGGARVVGLDISGQMLRHSIKKNAGYPFPKIQGDMLYLPFKDNSFEKSVSITALEFIADAKRAVDELFRITRPGGYVVVATLNSLSPWAARRTEKTQKGQKHILEGAFFRSPHELLTCSPFRGIAKTAIHFQKNDAPEQAVKTEQLGEANGLDTGAFLAVRWQKPRLL